MDGQFVCWHVPTRVLSGLTNQVLSLKQLELIELSPIQSSNEFTEAITPAGKRPWVTPKLSLMQSDDTEGGKGGGPKEPDTKGPS